MSSSTELEPNRFLSMCPPRGTISGSESKDGATAESSRLAPGPHRAHGAVRRCRYEDGGEPMPAKILVHSPDREVASLFATMLQQYRHEVFCATSIDVSAQLARSAGPLDLVLCLDDRAAASELKSD